MPPAQVIIGVPETEHAATGGEPQPRSEPTGFANEGVNLGTGQRLWEVWPAKSQFFCDGRCITGPFHGATMCAWICILLPSTIYAIFALPRCWRDWHPMVPIAAIAVFGLTVLLLLFTCCTDPGVLPRRSLLLATGTADELSAVLGYNVLGTSNNSSGADDDRGLISPELAGKGYRWCRTCQIVRPPRASHCPDCDHCVLRFDHHCPFVNNCIGQRNYRYFVGFVFSAVILGFCVIPPLLWFGTLGDTVGGQAPSEGGSGPELDQTAGILIITLCAIVGVISAILLAFLIYHIVLISMGKTTKEHLRGRQLHVDADPTLFAPRGPQLFDPRRRLAAESVSAGLRGGDRTGSAAVN